MKFRVSWFYLPIKDIKKYSDWIILLNSLLLFCQTSTVPHLCRSCLSLQSINSKSGLTAPSSGHFWQSTFLRDRGRLQIIYIFWNPTIPRMQLSNVHHNEGTMWSSLLSHRRRHPTVFLTRLNYVLRMISKEGHSWGKLLKCSFKKLLYNLEFNFLRLEINLAREGARYN